MPWKGDLTTQRGYNFYEVASALQKSIRRGDAKVAGYFAMELFPRYAKYCWRRLLTISAEDCFGAVTREIMSLYDAFQVINQGRKTPDLKGRVFIGKAVILLCACKHNRDADVLSNYIYDKKALMTDEEIDKFLCEVREEALAMPEYVYDCHTIWGKRRGKTKADFFKEEDEAMSGKQPSIFDKIDFLK